MTKHRSGDSQKKQKIMFLCHDLGIGGIQRVIVNMMKAMHGIDDFEVSCAVMRGGGELISTMPEEARIIELNCTSNPAALYLPNSKLMRCIGAERPDVIISFGHMTNLLAARAKLLSSVPFKLIMSEHSTLSERIGTGAFSRYRRIRRAKKFYRQADAVVCVSQGVADDLASLGIALSDQLRVIYNPILVPQEQMQSGRPALMSGEGPVFIAVGRLVKIKSYDVLLKAFSAVHDKVPNARLIFIGDGPERRQLESSADAQGLSGNVIFAGYQMCPYAWMTHASALVMSSECEGFANVIAEAMACGLNVVSTDCPSGPREILDGGRYGRLVPVGDAHAMAEAMIDILRNPLAADELKSAAQRFSVERSASEWSELIREVCAEKLI